MAYYYDTIKNPSTFVQRARAETALNLASQRAADERFTSTVSKWGRKHLFACRVLCNEPRRNLLILVPHYSPANTFQLHPCVKDLVGGPKENNKALAGMGEVQLVRAYMPDSLGYVWAALSVSLRPHPINHLHADDADDMDETGDMDDADVGPPSPKRQRTTQPPQRLGNYVSSAGYQISDSPSSQGSASTGPSSVGFIEQSALFSLEDVTVRLASCFIRCALNYLQIPSEANPCVQFRDERFSYQGRTPGHFGVRAIDDGGLQLLDGNGNLFHVAILEAKRAFLDVEDGEAKVPDKLLAQMVGETLALKLDQMSHGASKTDFITILAVTHHMKFFHFKITDSFISTFETTSPIGTESNPEAEGNPEAESPEYLVVDSTAKWFDISTRDGRQEVVRHLMAMVKWAKS